MKSKMSWLLLATVTVMVGFSSCDNNDDDGPTGPDNIAGIVANNPSFSILNAAIVKAGLGSALSGGSLTVFAPDNAAFEASNITAATISTLSAGRLDTILKYHVLGTIASSSAVPVSDTLKTLFGRNLFASRNTNGVFLNGFKVKTPDVAASNGVIHVIERVLIPPTASIAEIVSSDTSFSILLEAVKVAGLVGAVS
ncbi:MAG: fasciclin domain-containing protein, partial [Sphingobacteriales bacterium]